MYGAMLQTPLMQRFRATPHATLHAHHAVNVRFIFLLIVHALAPLFGPGAIGKINAHGLVNLINWYNRGNNMKLSKKFCWYTFQKAAMSRKTSFCTDDWIYDILYKNDCYRITNKRPANKTDIVTKQDEHNANMPDGTPLYFTDGSYKPLLKKRNK